MFHVTMLDSCWKDGEPVPDKLSLTTQVIFNGTSRFCVTSHIPLPQGSADDIERRVTDLRQSIGDAMEETLTEAQAFVKLAMRGGQL